MTQSASVEILLQEGHNQLDRGQYEAALEAFHQATELEPQNPQVLYGLGLACYRLERYHQSVECLNQALQINPSHIWALLWRGKAYHQLKLIERANADFEQAIQIKPQDYKDWRAQGDALNELQRYEEAAASYDKAIELKPDYYDAYNNWGNVLSDLGRSEEAIASYDKAIEINPDRYQAWYNRGLKLGNLGRHEEAIASFDKTLELKPDNQEVWINRGVALFISGCYDQAIISFNKVLELNSNNSLAWYHKGAVLQHLGRYEEASICFEQAVTFNPDFLEAWGNRGVVLDNLGRYAEAIACFDRTLSINPNNGLTLYNKGMALGHLGRYEEAITNFDKAIKIKPSDHQAWNNRSKVLSSLERWQEVLASSNQVIEIKPDDHEAWANRGCALGNLGRHEEALTSLGKAIEIKPDYHEAWNNQGGVLFKLGLSEEAIASCDCALQLTHNQFWQAWENRGAIIFRLRGYQAALQNWDEGLHYLQPESEHQEGCGVLHYCKGRAHYLEGRRQQYPFIYWLKAQSRYHVARQILPEEFREQHLGVLQDLIIVCRGLGQTDEAQELWREGNELWERLLQDTPSPGKKLLLARKFAGFTQLRVDWYVQSGEPVAALELAEERKNTCLRWLRYGWSDQLPRSPKFPDIQKLLNSQTATVYWHVSPAAITTFILRHNEPPQVHSAPATADDVTYPAAARQLRDFEDWVKDWKQNYQDYRAGKEKGTEEKLSTVEGKKPALKDHPWRKKMTAKLEELKNILNIPGILVHLSGIHHLILIPHRDLHLLPLHDLFPEDFTITYLPSAQIGLDLQQPKANPGQRLLNVENPQNDLRYATVESATISLLYPHSTTPMKGQQASRTQVITTVQTDEQLGVFHFTGHGQHDINQPLESSLLLAGEDELTLRDIFQLDFSRYHLICLSACETALTSKQGLIDEFVGLLSGFLAKGAAYVISALWAVDEYSTALMMVHFYECLQADMTPPFALKEAQKWLRTVTYSELIQWYQDLIAKFEVEGKNQDIVFDLKSQVRGLQRQKNSATINPDQPPYAHPYYWAGFTVTGKV